MNEERWYAIYAEADGSLYSTGTVVASAEVLAENGMVAIAMPVGMNPQDGTWEWDALRLRFKKVKVVNNGVA